MNSRIGLERKGHEFENEIEDEFKPYLSVKLTD
jgi:hypothetical protein